MIVLDTHALVWLSEGSAELGRRARQLSDDALAEEALAVSAICFWEVAMLRRRGRVELGQPIDAWRIDLIDMGLREIEIDGDLAIAAAELADFHDDPADRIIVATASRLGATLISADGRIQDWSGELRRHDART